MLLAHKTRLYPNNKAISYFLQACGVARFAYNWALAKWKFEYEAGEQPSSNGLVKEFNSIKKDQFPWTGYVTKWAPQKAIQDLGEAFKRFCKKTSKHPRFKKKGRSKDSFYLGIGHFKIEGRKIRIPKLGWVKMAQSVRFPGKHKSVTISREASGKWFVSVSVGLDEESWVYPHICESQASVGMDLGIKHLAILSNGHKIDNPRVLRRFEHKLKRAQQDLARKKKGSRNRHKARLLVARLHAKIKNIRQDYIHKFTATLVKSFRFIGLEDLNVAGMIKNHCLAKSIQDVSWSELVRQLIYKSKMAGSQLVFADRFFASSKLCSSCGSKNVGLKRGDGSWICSSCKTSHDRDVNAAINLEKVARRYRETTLNACGEDVRPEQLAAKATSMKQESGCLLTNLVAV